MKGNKDMAYIFAFITCTRVKREATVEEMAEMEGKTVDEVKREWEGDIDYDADYGTIRLEDAIEENGWIDRPWSLTVLYDSRNDVTPVIDCDEDDEWLADEVKDVLNWLEGGYEDNGNGVFYATQSRQPMNEPWSYSYAIHFTQKGWVNGRWTESPWIPPMDMRP